jgi:hypothetical protein
MDVDVYNIVNTRRMPVLPVPAKVRTRVTCDRNKVFMRARQFQTSGYHNSAIDVPLYSSGYRSKRTAAPRPAAVRQANPARLSSVLTNSTPVFVSGPYVKLACK